MKAAEVLAVPPLARRLHVLALYLSQDFLGGPKIIKLAWVINFQKFGTAFFVAALMVLYQNFTTAAWVYLALHGTYGFCWLLKHFTIPDRRWESPVTFGGAFMSFLLVLGPYWVAPWLLISGAYGAGEPAPSNALLALSISLHTAGLALMIGSDAQKYFLLRARSGLITDGFFKFIRHPNYLGEIMIYASYALLAGHWLPWLILVWIWAAVFLVNMLVIEASLARYPDWESYRRRTGMLLPRLW